MFPRSSFDFRIINHTTTAPINLFKSLRMNKERCYLCHLNSFYSDPDLDGSATREFKEDWSTYSKPPINPLISRRTLEGSENFPIKLPCFPFWKKRQSQRSDNFYRNSLKNNIVTTDAVGIVG
ncbi:CLUMA_CG001305, isoform A [Clunio marinus]|uniref:CLUMA_CG001305, isoform A n=1 Tax=Clunio marinus TaxID=568069 RepID=A0A1J1HHJ4_9DIPT|nr:CLUMA_CG001305, isoform A [Clunio marinus]